MADVFEKTKEHRLVNNVLNLRQRVAREELRQGGLSIVDRAVLEKAIQKATPVYDALSLSPPEPRRDETAWRYRARVVEDLKGHSIWKKSSPGSIAPGAGFDLIEREVLAAARARGLDPTYRGHVPAGQLRERKVVDQSGRENTVFHGDPADCWRPFCTPSQTAVKQIQTPSGRRLYPRD
jgi:hypothetical protein